MVIAIGCDHAGLALKKEIINWLKSEDYEVVDCGTFSEESVDYPDIAYEVAGQVLSRGCTGILICGTGIGIPLPPIKLTASGQRYVKMNLPPVWPGSIMMPISWPLEHVWLEPAWRWR